MNWLLQILGIDKISIERMVEQKLERERLFREDFSFRLHDEMKTFIQSSIKLNVKPSPVVFANGEKVFIHTVDGHRLFLDPNEMFMTLHLLEHGEWESHVRELLRVLLEPGSLYVDIGANTGVHALLAASIVGAEGKVVAVEPHPRILSFLHDNMEINGLLGRVKILPFALADKAGKKIDFEYFDKHPAMSGFKVSPLALHRFNATASKIKVQCETLDKILSQEKKSPDLIKIDVEGFETVVLKGAERTIAKNPDVAFLVEHQATLANSVLQGSPSLDLFNFFSSRGFSIVRFRDSEPPAFIVEANLMLDRGGDYLFCRPDSAPYKKITTKFQL